MNTRFNARPLHSDIIIGETPYDVFGKPVYNDDGIAVGVWSLVLDYDSESSFVYWLDLNTGEYRSYLADTVALEECLETGEDPTSVINTFSASPTVYLDDDGGQFGDGTPVTIDEVTLLLARNGVPSAQYPDPLAVLLASFAI